MEKKQKKAQALIWIIVIILIVVVGTFFFLKQPSGESQQTNSKEETSTGELSNLPGQGELGTGGIFQESNVKEFDVTAKRWEFDPDPIKVNEGDKVILNIKSIDVAHGIAIPDFGISARLNPGKETRVEFIADKKGTFTFFCNVQCGSGHSLMRGQLIVE